MVNKRTLAEGSDVFVVGGGPAGIAAALAARQRGLEVTVADSCAPPIDKPCGEGLMPDGIAALRKLGVTIPATQAQQFHGIRFVSSELSVEAQFPYGYALGVRRTNLHSIMVEAAERAGVRFAWQAAVTGLHGEGAMVRDKLFRARFIIGADGNASRVRRWAGLDVHKKKEQRFAFRRHYLLRPWTEFMELHWGKRSQVYVTPVGAEEVCVALISRDPHLRLDEALREFPELHKKLGNVRHGSVERGAVSVTRRLAYVAKDRVALIGDASGGVDAITGEGLCLAFRQADLLANCMSAGNLSTYQQGHRAILRRPAIMARLMLLLEKRSGLRHRVMQAFMAEPQLFARMLSAHVGASSPAEVTSNGLALGWRMLTA